ncbi:MAG: SET domain-containing protein-lysine N-methyltransferase [Bacteroidetes bacterium HGW-Bacteroidetes-21]|jgi:hypothetical protein|nr:MAG: SET domain-containing protein-lysine N-methyltransferase [Bacteroidetes bacterium HGW-Bacteroidetes-21]
MLVVKTYLGLSQIHGIGLFAGEDIQENTIIWKFVKGFDLVMTREEKQRLPKATQLWFNNYAYYNTPEGGYVLCADDGRFMNHAKDNKISDRVTYTIANRLIKKGEEMTCNYFEFDEEAMEKLKQH